MSVKTHYIEFRNALSKNDIQKAREEFEKAFNESFLFYQQKMTNNEKFDVSNEEELFALVTLFDNIIGYYKEKMYEEGISYCENLIELIDSPKLKEMFKGFSLGMQKGIDIDTFFKEYVDSSKVDAEFPMFLCNFKEKIKELI
ncbi:DNA polymerase III subunit alpha [Lebetimonas sp. JH292]|uniref:DNA polymerase III subunit alpha n=1 Tax=Lebetimonas sp. JH292 TaxID=990068 RepID=UPI00046344F3|nr:DNA polymerase III subunit alpha [Lebetimonas sp. JH292]